MLGRSRKYAALRKYLREKAKQFHESGVRKELDMTFEQIGALGEHLPPSAYRHRAWWSNSNHKRPWDSTGFVLDTVDMESKRLVFRYLGDFSREAISRQLKEIHEREPDRTSFFEQSRQKQMNDLDRKLKEPVTGMADGSRTYSAEQKCHPAFGSMKGMIRIARGTDLTQPAADPKSWKPR